LAKSIWRARKKRANRDMEVWEEACTQSLNARPLATKRRRRKGGEKKQGNYASLQKPEKKKMKNLEIGNGACARPSHPPLPRQKEKAASHPARDPSRLPENAPIKRAEKLATYLLIISPILAPSTPGKTDSTEGSSRVRGPHDEDHAGAIKRKKSLPGRGGFREDSIPSKNALKLQLRPKRNAKPNNTSI